MEAREITDDSWTRTNCTNRLVLMAKEPTTLFAYWEVDALHKRLACEHFHTQWRELPLFLQMYDVSDILFDGYNAHSVRQIQLHVGCDNWYITNLQPGRRYLADLGTVTLQGQFFTILRSNISDTPPNAAACTLEPIARFGSLASASGVSAHQMARIDPPQPQPDEAITAAQLAARNGIHPFNSHQAWRQQFDGYHLVAQKGGNA